MQKKKIKTTDQPEQINFKYIFDNLYNPTYINGAIGGVTPSKEIVANFYCERHGLPHTETHVIKSDGSIGDIIKRDPEMLQPYVIRFIECGVILNLKSARKIYSWLGDQIKKAEMLNESESMQSK